MKVFLLLTPQTPRSPGSLRLLVVLKDFWHLIKRNQIDILNNLNKQTDITIAPCLVPRPRLVEYFGRILKRFMTRGQLVRRLMLLALKLAPRLVPLVGSQKSITECGRVFHAPARPSINYVFCRFVAFKDDAIKLPEVGREPSRGSNVYPVTLLLPTLALAALSLSRLRVT